MALELGFTPGRLRRTLTEREFYDFTRYARDRGGLPQQRIELMLARIAMLIDVGMCGNKNAKLSDYLPEGERRDQVADDAEIMLGGGAGGTVIHLPKERLRPFQHG